MSSLYYMLLLFNKHTRRVISLFWVTPGLIKVLRTFQSRCENSKQDYYYYYIHSSNIWVTTIQLKELDGSDFCQVPCFPAELASVSIQSILSGSCFMDSKSAVMQTLSECSGMEQCWNESMGKVSKQKKSQYGLYTYITQTNGDELWGHLHSSWFLVHIVTVLSLLS